VRVALVSSEPVEPALLAYCLELAGVGPWDGVAVFDPADAGGLRRFVGDDERPAGPIDASFAWGEPGDATVHVIIHDDRRVQVLAACDVEPCRHPVTGEVAPRFRAAARVGAGLAAAGAVGRFAVALDAANDIVGVDPTASDHALATMHALRANAVRTGWIEGSWRSVLDALRSSGAAWNPVARAGVVVFPGPDGLVELVALGNARFEAEQCFAAAVAATSLVLAA
jgi:hypothetical protein